MQFLSRSRFFRRCEWSTVPKSVKHRSGEDSFMLIIIQILFLEDYFIPIFIGFCRPTAIRVITSNDCCCCLLGHRVFCCIIGCRWLRFRNHLDAIRPSSNIGINIQILCAMLHRAHHLNVFPSGYFSFRCLNKIIGCCRLFAESDLRLFFIQMRPTLVSFIII